MAGKHNETGPTWDWKLDGPIIRMCKWCRRTEGQHLDTELGDCIKCPIPADLTFEPEDE